MNIFAFALAIIAICVFAGAFRGYKHATLGVGLAILTIAWMIQLIFTGLDQIVVR